MTCEQMSELLPDYFQQQLDASRDESVKRHLRECSVCAEQAQLWKQLGELEAETPSPALKKRFDAMLSAYQEGRWEHDHLSTQRGLRWSMLAWLRAPLLPQAAMAVLILALGFGLGRYRNTQPASSPNDFAALHREIASMKQLVVLSMLRQQSASERLQGVHWSYQVAEPDSAVLSALIRSLKTDGSVDVRLAALDSLRRYSKDIEVRRGLMDALEGKQSPLVQIALIDTLVETRDAHAVAKIQELQRSPKINPIVRERAKSRLAKLSRG